MQSGKFPTCFVVMDLENVRALYFSALQNSQNVWSNYRIQGHIFRS